MNSDLAQLDKLKTARDLVHWGADFFENSDLHFGHGADNALDEALALVRYAAGIDWQSDEMVYDEPLSVSTVERCLALFNERVSTRRPAAYLTNEAWFAGLKFYVNEDVLIPRSPFAELIDAQFEPWLAGKKPSRILDLCTGRGCIAIACAYAFPEAEVDGCDLSDKALAIARQNITAHGLDTRMKMYSADVFKGIPAQEYDLIVSNPPYVSSEEMQTLPAEFEHEPRMALEAEDEGLAIVERMLHQAPQYMTDDAWLVVEVGNTEEAVAQRWPDLPLVWLEFERGGHGVFIIDALNLRSWLNKSV